MTRVVKGVKMIAYPDDGVIVRQRIKILDDKGNLVKAPMIEIREKKKHDKERLEEVKKRAEEILEQRLEEVERRLGEKIKNTSREK